MRVKCPECGLYAFKIHRRGCSRLAIECVKCGRCELVGFDIFEQVGEHKVGYVK